MGIPNKRPTLAGGLEGIPTTRHVGRGGFKHCGPSLIAALAEARQKKVLGITAQGKLQT
jgi:hypothetical protein